MYLSEYIIDEVERVFTEPYFSRRITPEQQRIDIQQLRTANIVDLTIPVSDVATQPKDDPILATALNARADYLVTGDRALLELAAFEGTRIVSVADFVAILEASQGDTPS